MSINSDDEYTATGGVLLPSQLFDDPPSRRGSTETVRAPEPDHETQSRDRHTLPGSLFPSQVSGAGKSLKQLYLDTVGDRLFPVSVYDASFHIHLPENSHDFGTPTCDGFFDEVAGCVSFLDDEGNLQLKSMRHAKLFGMPPGGSGVPSQKASSPTVIVGDVQKVVYKNGGIGQMESCTGLWGAVTKSLPSTSELSRKET